MRRNHALGHTCRASLALCLPGDQAPQAAVDSILPSKARMVLMSGSPVYHPAPSKSVPQTG